MAVTPSTMDLPLGTVAPLFNLPDARGERVCIDDFWDRRALVVAFLAPHCPYVRHLRGALAALAREYAERGAGFVAIMPNDLERSPQDGPEEMLREAEEAGYTFPYLLDAEQAAARAYRAACTPDFFVFDTDRLLVYRGRFDESRPGSGVPATGRDLRAALDAVLEGRPAPDEQWPSMGCGIKWKPGSEPDGGG